MTKTSSKVATSTAKKVVKTAPKTASSVKQNTSTAASRVRSAVNSTINAAKKTAVKAADKVQSAVSSVKKSVSDGWNKLKSAFGFKGSTKSADVKANSGSMKVTTNLGNGIDITPSKNHSAVPDNPGPKGVSDSGIDM
ncbi:MAG: hypothetical protein J6K04_04205 [Lachnospiraceae bacterium]|nr:hypothetical protein [Lachnospiraceae bacterium]